jgi:hypothetical protein
MEIEEKIEELIYLSSAPSSRGRDRTPKKILSSRPINYFGISKSQDEKKPSRLATNFRFGK